MQWAKMVLACDHTFFPAYRCRKAETKALTPQCPPSCNALRTSLTTPSGNHCLPSFNFNMPFTIVAPCASANSSSLCEYTKGVGISLLIGIRAAKRTGFNSFSAAFLATSSANRLPITSGAFPFWWPGT